MNVRLAQILLVVSVLWIGLFHQQREMSLMDWVDLIAIYSVGFFVGGWARDDVQ